MKKKLFSKLLVLALSLALVLAFSACGKENTTSQDPASNGSQTKGGQEIIVSENTAASQENQESKPQNNAEASKPQTNSEVQNTKPSNNTQISKSKATEIALNDAGLKASEIYDFEIELDNDRGVLHYDVSFEKDGKDYDYEIDAKSGKILSVEKPKATSQEVKISENRAKSIALTNAGLKDSEISRFESELEKDNGVWQYEISFQKGNVEYDYIIDAVSGQILRAKTDIDD